jgi:hypothetical protein
MMTITKIAANTRFSQMQLESIEKVNKEGAHFLMRATQLFVRYSRFL